MKKWTHWVLPLALALLLIIPVSVQAGIVHEGYKGYKGHGKGGWVHHEMYLSLLVEKYAADRMDEWGPALAERKRLMDELKALYEANPDRTKKEMKAKKKKKDDQNDPMREQLRESHQRFEEAIQSKDDAKIKAALEEQLANIKEHNKKLASRVAELKQSN